MNPFSYFALQFVANILTLFLHHKFSFQSREKMMKGVRRGCVRLRGAIIGIDDQDVNTFTITVDHKTFHFQVSIVDAREVENANFMLTHI